MKEKKNAGEINYGSMKMSCFWGEARSRRISSIPEKIQGTQEPRRYQSAQTIDVAYMCRYIAVYCRYVPPNSSPRSVYTSPQE